MTLSLRTLEPSETSIQRIVTIVRQAIQFLSSAAYADPYNNVIGGTGAGANLGPSSGPASSNGYNVTIGAYSGASLVPNDYGNSLVGAFAGTLLTNGGAVGYNTCIGHGAGTNLFNTVQNGGPGTPLASYFACVAIGRSAGAGWTSDSYNVSIGHGSMFKGGGNVGVVALGDTAAGAAIDGTATNWQGTGLTYWGAINDTNVAYLGRMTGKASAAARTNCLAIGALARVPLKDNAGAIGRALTDISTAARMWDGTKQVTESSGASLTHTLTAASMVAGFVTRTGTPAAGVGDTTDTAAAIVAAGPGAGCEVPLGRMLTIQNSTGQLISVGAGSGVTVSGFSAINNGAVSIWYVFITNAGSGTEAVTLQRGGT